ncbi:collagen alpha-1(XIV) chain-like [Coregonus clupeaformis]|uniref:collagen alpha-1(XIV) chain-like n=1 Tax=Coregonus clupeaformis TaxID=59861 RepID=UPI001E1C8EE6|nr:collagen alpha-1(XIV) chain-like [Coregonus clupeaformis]
MYPIVLCQVPEELQRSAIILVGLKASSPSQLSKPALKVSSQSQLSKPALKVSSQSQLSKPALKVSSQSQLSKPALKVSSQSQLSKPALKVSSQSQLSKSALKASSPSQLSKPALKASSQSCSTAVNDLVYITDRSWCVGHSDFQKAKNWLVNITSGFDVSSHYSQVAVVQRSNTPYLEVSLGKHRGGPDLIQAIEGFSYLGGDTQTGQAIKFAVDHVFPSSQRASAVKIRIAVVKTDAKSQDDVMDASVEARAQGRHRVRRGRGQRDHHLGACVHCQQAGEYLRAIRRRLR